MSQQRRQISFLEHLRIYNSIESAPGHRLLLDFLLEMDAGKVALTPTTIALAAAFQEILLDDVNPRDALNLKTKAGRPANRRVGTNAVQKKVVTFIAAQTKKNPPVPITHAYEKAAVKFSKSRRHIEQIWQRHRNHELFRQQLLKVGKRTRRDDEVKLADLLIVPHR